MKKSKKEKELIENIAKMGKDLVVMQKKEFVRLMEDELDTYEMFDEAMKLIRFLNKALELSEKEIESLNVKLNDANKEIERLNEALLMEMD